MFLMWKQCYIPGEELTAWLFFGGGHGFVVHVHGLEKEFSRFCAKWRKDKFIEARDAVNTVGQLLMIRERQLWVHGHVCFYSPGREERS